MLIQLGVVHGNSDQDTVVFKGLLSKEGLIVVDAYSAWCGPCKAIVSSFKK